MKAKCLGSNAALVGAYVIINTKVLFSLQYNYCLHRKTFYFVHSSLMI